MCCFFPWSCGTGGQSLSTPVPAGDVHTHPVLQGLLDQREAFPARLKLLSVAPSEEQEVLEDLQGQQ